jgi:hypothetical protein
MYRHTEKKHQGITSDRCTQPRTVLGILASLKLDQFQGGLT